MAEKNFSKMDKDVVKGMKVALQNQDFTLAVGKIQDYFKEQDKLELDIAVIGESGSGKSTFINAFRDLGDEDDDSAPTGVVETTLDIKEYLHPKYPNVKLWDLPGIGTPKFQADKYLVDGKFERYDFFIIVASDRFRECHVLLAREIQKMKKNFYFLRNKIDINIAAEKRRKPKTFNEEKTLEAIRQDCIKGLRKIDEAAPDVFLISCFELGLYDFNRLLDTVEKELPQQKRHVLLLALPNLNMEIHQKKKKALQADIWRVALLSGAAATVPVPGLSFGVDAHILLKEIEKYKKTFNIDDNSLQKLAKRSGVPVEELKSEMKNIPKILFNVSGVIQVLACASALAAVEGSAEYIVSLIPAVGSFLAGGMSFATTYYMLSENLEEIATDAQNVLKRFL